MKYQVDARIISNEETAPGHFEMALEAPQIALAAMPGQFLQVRCASTGEPLLRRPFSVHSVALRRTREEERGTIEILYKVVGAGTEILSKKRRGEKLDVIGPLGNGFTLSPVPCPLSPVLVAGGMGVAPLLYLAEKIVSARKIGGPATICGGHSPSPSGRLRSASHQSMVHSRNFHVIIGARTKKLLLCEDEFKKLGAKVVIATEDGSKGKRGFASEALADLLRVTGYGLQVTNLYACGPHEMLKAVAKIAAQHEVPCQVSLEEHMACGIGACLGCVVQVRGGYKRVCAEGPVFEAGEVVW